MHYLKYNPQRVPDVSASLMIFEYNQQGHIQFFLKSQMI